MSALPQDRVRRRHDFNFLELRARSNAAAGPVGIVASVARVPQDGRGPLADGHQWKGDRGRGCLCPSVFGQEQIVEPGRQALRRTLSCVEHGAELPSRVNLSSPIPAEEQLDPGNSLVFVDQEAGAEVSVVRSD